MEGCGHAAQALDARHALLAKAHPGPEQAGKHGLGLADEEGVEEGGDGLGVGRVRSSSQDQGVALPSVGGATRQAAEVEHRQDVGVAQLGLQREAHDVEVREGPGVLEGDEGQAACLQLLVRVGPGHHATIGEQALLVVCYLVEDARAHVAHRDLVDVGKAQEHAPAGGFPPGLAARAVLGPEVTPRALHLSQEAGVGVRRRCGARGGQRWGVL